MPPGVRLASAALVVAALAGGCGGGQRSDVAGYIKDVNAIEIGLRGPLAEVVRANRQIGGRADLKALAPRLARSEATIATLRAHLAALKPPPAATRLHPWSRTVSLASGTHTLTATQTLIAGVTSAASAAVVVVVPSH